jgi:serine/threonine protein phosphatase PrpC
MDGRAGPPMSLVTPREPATPRREGARRERSTVSQEATLTTRWAQLELAVASGRSKRHAVNEDSYSALDRTSPVYVVADGVGGGAMASWASRELVLRLHAALDRRRVDAQSVCDALLDADREVGRAIAKHTATSGAATVALCAATGPLLSRWLIAWVGDCRIYRLRAALAEPAELLTRDDTYVLLGEDPPPGGSPDDPARMVGNGAVTAPNVESVRLRAGEMLVLCSDGLHKHVEPHEINRQMRADVSLAHRCTRLLELARARGSNDDATLLVVHRKASGRSRLARLASGGGLLALLLVAWAVSNPPGQSSVPPPHATMSRPERAPLPTPQSTSVHRTALPESIQR